VKTGNREEYCTNNICDLAGNVCEWTQEQEDGQLCKLIQEQDECCKYVVRGGLLKFPEADCPVAYRCGYNHDDKDNNCGFRASLYLK
jgi:formylglycine-generating enzyme required for sulfatase activity